MALNSLDTIKLGTMAYMTGKTLCANPHQTGTLAWTNWSWGWIKAKQDDIKLGAVDVRS